MMKLISRSDLAQLHGGGGSGGMAIKWFSGDVQIIVSGSWNDNDSWKLNDKKYVLPKILGLTDTLMRIYPPN